jgi:thiol-disulfide isomerase/thioredoxin
MANSSSLSLASILLVAASSLVGCGGAPAEAPESAAPAAAAGGGLVGQPAPALNIESVAGNGPTTLDAAKGKVVIVDFWATYCDPCKKSFPKYQELVDQFGGELIVMGVSVDEGETTKKEALLDFVKKTGVKFPILWDKDQIVVKKYAPPKMPTSYIIDKGGVVRFTHAGFEAGEEVKIAEEVKGLLK